MNGRLYDARLGRFVSPDNFVQDPWGTQTFNRYGYALNNPLIYVDPDGEIIFGIPILAGIIWGAIIGAGTAAVAYSVGAAISGNWSWSDFGNSVALGAVGGAIGGGFSAIGGAGLLGQFGNSIGYNMLSQSVNTVATNMMFGYDINMGIIGGMVFGGLVGAGIPNFNPARGSGAGTIMKNAGLELAYSTGKGAATGFASGIMNYYINGSNDENIIWNNVLGGAIGGFSNTLFNIGVMGPAMSFDDSYIPHGTDRPIHRGGGLADWLDGSGISLGRNAYGSNFWRDDTRIEESFHYLQQKQMGFARFYGRIFSEALRFGFEGAYFTKGTLENDAKIVRENYNRRLPFPF